MRIAWFSPLPPIRSGIAAYSAELLPTLRADLEIDAYQESNAHDFAWRARRDPYNLVVYQLGNAPCHDYMWAYLAAFPGLVVLHDARLHHSRARRLLNQRRFDDYRREFLYDHPDARPEFAEYAIQGLGGSIYYFWSMLRVVMRTARTVAVHNARVADQLREAYPGVAIEAVRMGVPQDPAWGGPPEAFAELRRRVRGSLGISDAAMVFAVFGRVTAEKRIAPILGAVGALGAEGHDVFLLLVGDTSDYAPLVDDLARHGIADRVRVTGYIPDEAIGAHLAAVDACVCLRWPTALETSASWLRCLAAGRPTLVTDLAHLVDIPTLDPRDSSSSSAGRDPVALRIDLLDEEPSLLLAMRRLVKDTTLRTDLARAGRAYWAAHHTIEAMADDYRTVIALAAGRQAAVPADLPSHFLEDHTESARQLAQQFGVAIDILIR